MGTILIVDDDFDFRETLLDILKGEGFQVATAGDGLDALAYLRSHPAPCLILLDWMMPRCDGVEFREAQKADPALASIPVVLLTAHTRPGETMTAVQANALLEKPVTVKGLLEVVRRFCSTSTGW